MDGFEAMMAGMMSGKRGASEMKPIAISDLKKGFSSIPDLKPGDKVRAKNENYNCYST